MDGVTQWQVVGTVQTIPQVRLVAETSHNLREGITLEHLREPASALTNVQAADQLNEALFSRGQPAPAEFPYGAARSGGEG
ncbi:MAG: hypothetical protein JSS17_13620 [Proteobacteria bacterium]|nr:hypothetical protein [Pseudomonadota bacterium]